MKVLLTVTVQAIVDITEAKGSAAISVQHFKTQTAALLVNPEQPSQVPTDSEANDYRMIAKMYALTGAAEEATRECEEIGEPTINQNVGEA